MKWYRIVPLVLATTVLFGDEQEEVKRIAQKYQLQQEVVLEGGTRADLVSKDFAIEVDWSDKWAESIGQSLYYALVLGKRPGIVLIRREECSRVRHSIYLDRCKRVCIRYEIGLWSVEEGSSGVTKVWPEEPFQ